MDNIMMLLTFNNFGKRVAGKVITCNEKAGVAVIVRRNPYGTHSPVLVAMDGANEWTAIRHGMEAVKSTMVMLFRHNIVGKKQISKMFTKLQ